jgi:carbon starvation protein
MALIAATAMPPGDYFAINVAPATFATMTFQGEALQPVNIASLEAAIGETVAGRTGGAVSLAAGMAYIFSALPGMSGLLAYWYHFAIMFEALFILTTIDAGTRVGRFLLQEFMGRVHAPFAQHGNKASSVIATSVIVLGWGYFIYTGQISTIWPLFAVANQLLASIALAVATSILINMGKAKYVWVTIAPLVFLAVNTLYGGFLNIRDNYYPIAVGVNAARHTEGWVLTVCSSILMVLSVVVLSGAIQKWVSVLNGGPVPATAEQG